jgi:glucokinase
VDSDNLFLGIDLGGTNIKYGIVDQNGTHSKFSSVPTPQINSINNILDTINTIIEKSKKKCKSQKKTLQAIGMGVPALVDPDNGLILNAPNLKIKDFPIAREIQKKAEIPVFIDNDANVMLEGEMWLGAAAGLKDAILLTLGTGVGGAILCGGKLIHGSRGVAGEIGHMVIDINGNKCNCGNHGCFEGYASATALVRLAREILEIKGHDLSKSSLDISNLTAKGIFDAALLNDPVAIYATEQFSEYLGIGIANLVNIFNPYAVILSGGVVKAGAALFGPVRKVVQTHIFKEKACKVKVIPAKFDDKGGILGAARMAMKRRGI